MCGCEQGTCPGDCSCGCRHTPPTKPLRRKRFTIARQPSCFLVGASWAHHVTFKARSTHVYLGFWVLTIKTKATS